jgi:hypothetical protein
MRCRTCRGSIELCLEPVQLCEAIALGFIPEVVGQTRERIDRQQVLAEISRQYARRDREVLPMSLGTKRVPCIDLHPHPAPDLATPKSIVK